MFGLTTTPYLIHELGASFYGVFALITIMSAYLTNLEMGFGGATVRFLARARGMGNAREELHVLGTSLFVFVCAASLAGFIALAASSFIAQHFVHGSAILHAHALDAIRMSAFIIFVSMLSAFASASLVAMGRFRLVVGARACFGTAASGGACIAVVTGGGLRSIVAVQCVIAAAPCVVLCRGLGRASPARLWPRLHRETLRSMGGYAVFIVLAGLTYQIMLQGPPTVLAGHVPTSELAAFAVPAVALQQLISLASATSLAFLSFASTKSASKDRAWLADVFRSNLRMTLLVFGPIAAYLIVFGHVLLAAWIDPAFAADAFGPTRWLALAALMIGLSGPPADVARGLGQPSWVVWFTSAASSIALGCSFAMVSSEGATGVALAMVSTRMHRPPFRADRRLEASCAPARLDALAHQTVNGCRPVRRGVRDRLRRVRNARWRDGVRSSDHGDICVRRVSYGTL